MRTGQAAKPSAKTAGSLAAASAHQRWRLLHQLGAWLDGPMAVLSFVWLGLLVLDMTGKTNGLFQWLGTLIWVVFVLDFALRFTLAPRKLPFLARNWLTLLSLAAPALRLLRFVRVLRLLGTGGLGLIRVVGSLNRGMNALRKSLGRRRVGYVVALTLVVVFVGAAGMLQFEGATPRNGQGFAGYADALWWTAMLLTTIGSQYWPLTPEGRILCVLLSLYSISVVGYVTAALATFFVGRDAGAKAAENARTSVLERLCRDVSALQGRIAALQPAGAFGMALPHADPPDVRPTE